MQILCKCYMYPPTDYVMILFDVGIPSQPPTTLSLVSSPVRNSVASHHFFFFVLLPTGTNASVLHSLTMVYRLCFKGQLKNSFHEGTYDGAVLNTEYTFLYELIFSQHLVN